MYINLSIYRQTSHVNLLESEGTHIYRVDFKIIEVLFTGVFSVPSTVLRA